MAILLSSEEAVEDFFESHFETSPLHIRHATRANRLIWMQHYRRFVPHNDIDALLSHNASAFTHGPLQLHTDLDLQRPTKLSPTRWARHHVETLFPAAPHKSRNAVDLPAVHRAFRDGLELVLHAAHLRTAALAIFAEGMRAFWGEPVSATLHLSPATPRGKGEGPAPELYAADVFIVQLDGALDVTLYEGMFPFPAERHVADPGVLQSAHETALEVAARSVILQEGDVLYLPRGCGVDMRASNALSLHVVLSVPTHLHTLDAGIVAVVDAVRLPDADNPLDEMLDDRPGRPGHDSTWLDFVVTAVKVAAEFTPELRRFLPLGEVVAAAIEDAGGEPVAHVVKEDVRRFSAAAKDALFDPVVELLVEQEMDGNLRHVAREDVVTWARSLVREAKRTEEGRHARERAKEMFKLCVATVAKSSVASYDGVTSLQLQTLEAEHVSRQRRIELRDAILNRHGVSDVNNTVAGGKTCGATDSGRMQEP